MRVFGSRTTLSPSSTSNTASCGTYFPITTSNTVSGVESSRPIGPHSHVQKTAATSTAIGETPVLEPITLGSTTLLTNSFVPTDIATLTRKPPYPGNAAHASASGTAAPSHGPM